MIGEILSLYLKVNNIKVRQFARQIDVSASTISRITRGEQVDQQTMLKLIQWLFKIRGEK